MRKARSKGQQHGQVLAEFSLAIFTLFIFVFAMGEMCHAVWTYARLTEMARRGARYAVSNHYNVSEIRNVVTYGHPNGGRTPALPGLRASHIKVSLTNESGQAVVPTVLGSNHIVSVSIEGYRFQPWFTSRAEGLGTGLSIQLPNVRARLLMESQGFNN